MGSLLTQIMREIKIHRGLESRPPSTNPDQEFYLYSNFSGLAGSLREQFEKKISGAIEVNDGLTPLLYAYCPDSYQFLTASAERIFSAELLDELLEKMRTWAGEILDGTHVSTPQLRVFVNGCYRDLLRDNVEARYHWVLSLARNGKQKIGQITVATETVSADAESASMSVDHLVSLDLEFNQLLVHEAANAYAIKPAKGSMDPALGAVFLDGYIW